MNRTFERKPHQKWLLLWESMYNELTFMKFGLWSLVLRGCFKGIFRRRDVDNCRALTIAPGHTQNYLAENWSWKFNLSRKQTKLSSIGVTLSREERRHEHFGKILIIHDLFIEKTMDTYLTKCAFDSRQCAFFFVTFIFCFALLAVSLKEGVSLSPPKKRCLEHDSKLYLMFRL